MTTRTEKNVSDYLDDLREEANKEGEKTGEEYDEYLTEYSKGFKNRIISKYQVREKK